MIAGDEDAFMSAGQSSLSHKCNNNGKKKWHKKMTGNVQLEQTYEYGMRQYVRHDETELIYKWDVPFFCFA